MCCLLVEITFHAHYNPQRDIYCHPTLYSRRLKFREIQSIAQVTQLKVMGSESQESPLLLPSCIPFKKNLTFAFRKFFQIANINVSGRSKEEEDRV